MFGLRYNHFVFKMHTSSNESLANLKTIFQLLIHSSNGYDEK